MEGWLIAFIWLVVLGGGTLAISCLVALIKAPYRDHHLGRSGSR